MLGCPRGWSSPRPAARYSSDPKDETAEGSCTPVPRSRITDFVTIALLFALTLSTGTLAVLNPGRTLWPGEMPPGPEGALEGSVMPGSGTAQSDDTSPDDDSAAVPQSPEATGLAQEDIVLLARLITAEAGGQPYEGQVAVGAVVMNRIASGLFASTVKGVVFQPGQFEVVRNGRINMTPTETALKAAQAAARGEDPTDGALYFFNPAKTSNRFLWSRPLKIVIGNHRFTS